jgi:pyruvate,water dikinase
VTAVPGTRGSDIVGRRSSEDGPAPRARWVRHFSEIGIADVPLVGGKNASLGEMRRELGPLGITVPDGFALTAEAFRHFLRVNELEERIASLLVGRTHDDAGALETRSRALRNLVLAATLPPDITQAVFEAYRELSERTGVDGVEVAVRSSATAEDLPGASFAGAHQTLLNVRGDAELAEAVRQCYASLYTARAIRYRDDMGFAHDAVALSVGVQQMLAADASVSGVIFTLDTETGFRDVVLIDAIYGLGENIVQGKVGPDEFYVHKPLLRQGKRPILMRKVGTKECRLVFDRSRRAHENRAVPPAERAALCLTDEQILQLARWAVQIEDHYSAKLGRPTPMDIEFARNGPNGPLCILQARPETVHSARRRPTIKLFELTGHGPVLVEGLAVGEQIAAGPARVLRSTSEIASFVPGEVLVAEATDPDWEPVLKRAAAVVTVRGGRTSHAAIVARELGIPAVVGATGAMARLSGVGVVTVSCAEGETGRVFEGKLPFRIEEIDPATLPVTRTRIMLNAGDPEQAFRLAMLPNDGVGLARMEFIFAGWVRVHPLALTRFESLTDPLRAQVEALTARYADKREYFVDTLSQGIGMLAGAFWPRPVILRFSDFKSNEYAHLLGGAPFEIDEGNPMLGWRGASRYYHPDYREAFLLEVAAVRRVREVMGLTNLQVMIPFCRTPDEGARVLAVMRDGGLERGVNSLEVYVMAEIPSNVILADRFAELFDGFSIGSNDLTQLILGVDRDSTRVAGLFDERNEAVTRACAALIETAHRAGRTVGICGQAPSDFPDFAAFLVEHAIDSISLNADALVRTRRRVWEIEQSRLALPDAAVATPAGSAA